LDKTDKKWKLEKRRIEALSRIVGERLFVELMVNRDQKTPRRACGKVSSLQSDGSSQCIILYALFGERVAWDDYIDEYEERMRFYTGWLFGATIVLSLLAILGLHFTIWFSPLMLFGLLCAGAAGSCVSVMAKMPALDVSLSGELDAYGRRI
jgi:hypothetical protein